jgi:hypothetical protein
VNSAIPVPRGSTITIRSRRLSVSRPIPTTPCLGYCRADHPQRLDRDRAVGIEVIRAVEIDGIDVAARHELLQIDHLRTFHVEGLQFLRHECDELAGFVFVTFDDLFFLHNLASAGIVRPQRDPSRCAGSDPPLPDRHPGLISAASGLRDPVFALGP